MHVAAIGLGLIGGSFAKAAAASGHEVSVWNRTLSTAEKALAEGVAKGILDETVTSAAGKPDLVFVSLPPDAVVPWIDAHQEHFKDGAIVVDATGVKRTICRDLEKYAFSSRWTFIGGHPMAGKEVTGYVNAEADLFKGASMILTPYPTCGRKALELLDSFFKGIGFSQVVVTTPRRHDEMIAYTSQLAHVVSAAYAGDEASSCHNGYSAGSFADMTRVAGVDPGVWASLFLANSDFLSAKIDGLISRLAEFRDALDSSDIEALCDILSRAKTGKERIVSAR
jgi:prephenate dehydrogenase